MTRFDLYQDWLKAAPPRAAVMDGLDDYDLVALDAAGMAALGREDLPGGVVVQRDGRLALGGYDEDRAIYATAAFAGGDEPRTIHLGLDIFANEGAPVYAPLDGIVHSFQDNAAPQDYGPTIILAHGVTSELTFYTLYGHLSRDSLEGLEVGQAFSAGQTLGWLGGPEVNGDWPPHLHIQIIFDLMGRAGDFPGVFKQSERETWKRNCPDPRPFLGLSDFS
jgi:murein DD-endopeptidase MepM/ murein hydrolase activator NlpD